MAQKMSVYGIGGTPRNVSKISVYGAGGTPRNVKAAWVYGAGGTPRQFFSALAPPILFSTTMTAGASAAQRGYLHPSQSAPFGSVSPEPTFPGYPGAYLLHFATTGNQLYFRIAGTGFDPKKESLGTLNAAAVGTFTGATATSYSYNAALGGTAFWQFNTTNQYVTGQNYAISAT